MKPVTEWVVYLTSGGVVPGSHGVCPASEWDGQGSSDRRTLVRRFTGSEGGAEQAARKLQPPPAGPPKPSRTPPLRRESAG